MFSSSATCVSHVHLLALSVVLHQTWTVRSPCLHWDVIWFVVCITFVIISAKKKKTVFCYILVKRGQCYTQMMLLKPTQFSGVISVCSRSSVKVWENVEGQETVTAALLTFSSTPKVGRTFITVRNVRCKDLNLWAFRGSPSSLLWMMKEQTAAQTKIGQIQGGEMLYLKVWR